MNRTQEYLTISRREQLTGGLLWQTVWEDNALRLSPEAFSGFVLLPPVDSGENGFRWSRLRLRAGLPADTALRVYARAADESPSFDALTRAEDPTALVRELFGPPLSGSDDLLLPCTGRYVWLALELVAGGRTGPWVESLSLWMEGDHMVDYLPAIYQGQDFTYRYLSIFNSMLQDMETRIETVSREIDPASAGEEMLRCIGQWLCVEPGESEESLRRRIPTLLHEYETMYTVEGVGRSVERLSGRRPFIIEHFMVDPNGPDCRNPQLYRHLYGENPYQFFILLPQDTFESQREMERFLTQMRELVPAECESGMELVLLKSCVQLDWHTYLGINSQIGSYIPAAIDESMTIHYDTTIGGADHER